jgi:hypothetical protein
VLSCFVGADGDTGYRIVKSLGISPGVWSPCSFIARPDLL